MSAASALTVSAAFAKTASRDRSRVAIRFEGQEISYGQLDIESTRLANALLGAGTYTAGDRVGILIGNRPEFLVVLLALARAGLVAVPLPVGTTPRELLHFANDSGMRALFVADELVERLAAVLEELDQAGVTVHGTGVRVGRGIVLDELVARGVTAPIDLARDDQPFFFGYTSGTTGRPKAAVVGHRARTLLALMYGQEYGCYTPDETHLITTPMYHGAGLGRAFAPLVSGGCIELHRHFDPEHVLASVASGEVTATFMVPTMLAAIFELSESALRTGAGRLRTVLSNASALPEHLKHRILEQWPGVRLFEIYGSTETGTVTSLRPEDQLRKARCVGQPLALTDVRLFREDGTEAEADEVGRLYCASPYLFSGYHANPSATEAVNRDGYVTAGDLARRDGEGYLYIVGRSVDVIVTGGVNVYPREVEELLNEHPLVREAAVFGVPDPRWGEAVHAVVVLVPGAGELSVAELLSHCRTGLAAPKVPKHVDVRDTLPRTPTGKVLKTQLALEASRRLGIHEPVAGAAGAKGDEDAGRF